MLPYFQNTCMLAETGGSGCLSLFKHTHMSEPVQEGVRIMALISIAHVLGKRNLTHETTLP